MTTSMTGRSINIFIFFIAFEIVIGVVALVLDGTTLTALQTTTRFSGRLSLLFFSLMLIFRNRSNQQRWVSENPFALFAVLHGIHLVELLFYVTPSGRELVPLRILGGFVAYLIIFVVPLISRGSTDHSLQQRSGLKDLARESGFNILKRIYFPYIWFIFFMAYLPRVTGSASNVGGTFLEHITLFIFVIIIGIVALIYRPKLVTATLQQP